jgi:hypothetical protein
MLLFKFAWVTTTAQQASSFKAMRITTEQLRKIRLGNVREEQKAQGFFDGRFVSRTEESKKKYTRKDKHKGKHLN